MILEYNLFQPKILDIALLGKSLQQSDLLRHPIVSIVLATIILTTTDYYTVYNCKVCLKVRLTRSFVNAVVLNVIQPDGTGRSCEPGLNRAGSIIGLKSQLIQS